MGYITLEKFAAYEKLRECGLVNMFDVPVVIALANGPLTHEDVMDIAQNYREYRNRWPQENKNGN